MQRIDFFLVVDNPLLQKFMEKVLEQESQTFFALSLQEIDDWNHRLLELAPKKIFIVDERLSVFLEKSSKSILDISANLIVLLKDSSSKDECEKLLHQFGITHQFFNLPLSIDSMRSLLQ